ncbi:hypothetical protein E2C01_082138 [Portunus trituberculatus]|uniref:Uncharacterized protein n=1 Tax=Portunus trituberculatus TaxID=210409 RepID=A0A5B7IRK4_PORTR|nr:hypothetical protein [Portunus trituberculatus]
MARARTPPADTMTGTGRGWWRAGCERRTCRCCLSPACPQLNATIGCTTTLCTRQPQWRKYVV